MHIFGLHSILFALSLQQQFHFELSKLNGPNWLISLQHPPSHDGVIEVTNTFSVSSGFIWW